MTTQHIADLALPEVKVPQVFGEVILPTVRWASEPAHTVLAFDVRESSALIEWLGCAADDVYRPLHGLITHLLRTHSCDVMDFELQGDGGLVLARLEAAHPLLRVARALCAASAMGFLRNRELSSGLASALAFGPVCIGNSDSGALGSGSSKLFCGDAVRAAARALKEAVACTLLVERVADWEMPSSTVEWGCAFEARGTRRIAHRDFTVVSVLCAQDQRP